MQSANFERIPHKFAKSTYICGIQNNYLYSLVSEPAKKLLCWQNLPYTFLYAEPAEVLWVQSTYILEDV